MSGLRIGSLFSGYAGLDSAVAQHYGATVAWHVEFDKHPSAILAHHYPDIPNYGDVTSVDWSAVEPVDIITGGFPCQDVSHAGLRAGVHQGTRSGLWFEMARAIDALQPRKVIIENVAGLLSADAACHMEPCAWCVGDEPEGHMRALGAVLADLAEMGLYDVRWGSVRAADAGAPHRRERVFIVAADADHGRRGQRLREGERVAAVAGDGSRTWPQDGDPDGLTLLPTPAVNDMGRGKTVEWWDEWAPRQMSADGRPAPHGKSLEIEAQRLLPTPTAQAAKHGSTPDVTANGYGSNLWDLPTLLPTPKASDGPNGGPGMRNGRGVADALPGVVTLLPTPTARDWKDGATRPDTVPVNGLLGRAVWHDFGPYTAAIARWEAVIGRPAPPPTEPGQNGRPRLSPRFVEFMMGLPDGWVTGVDIPRSAQLKALGNGVVPQQAALALALLDGVS